MVYKHRRVFQTSFILDRHLCDMDKIHSIECDYCHKRIGYELSNGCDTITVSCIWCKPKLEDYDQKATQHNELEKKK